MFLLAASPLGAHKVLFFSIYGKDLDQIYGDLSWEVMVPCLIIVINLPYKSYSVKWYHIGSAVSVIRYDKHTFTSL